MEDLYSNLENYDDVNAVDELKSENRELKHKLEECSKTMNQLQKDFDKLNSEYKKLELNYSSLLKTARAEIERKTLLITNLNKEKDMIVIRAMQGGCRNILKNVNKPIYNYKKKDGENKEMPVKHKPGLAGNSGEGSRESPLLLMKDNATVSGISRSTSSKQNLRQVDDGHSKENTLNIPQNQINDSNKPKTAKISARRKSMPVLSNCEEQISSEEDLIKDEYKNTKDLDKYQDYDHNRQNSQYLGSKVEYKNNRSEQFSNESKQGYSRDVARYNPHHDRYTSYNRNYNNYSPERGIQGQQRESDYSHRSDYYKQRGLESPPKDKYSRSKSKERRYRYRDNRWDFDNYNSRYQDNYDARMKTREPDPKRRRMDSRSTDRERHDHAAERTSYRFSEYRPDVANENHTSCQSPDYDQIESNLSHHFIKEIKNTATIQLEDPRINSKKYSLKESDQGTFITTVDKNTRMIPVDRRLWGFEKVEVPEALKSNIWDETPNEDVVNYIYMDIDDPDNICSSKSSKTSRDGSISISEAPGNPDDLHDCRKECSTSDKIYQKQKTNVSGSENVLCDHKIQKKSKVDVKSSTSVQENINKNEYNSGNRKHSSNHLKDETNEEINKFKTEQLAPFKHNIEGDLELSDEASDFTDELQITCKQNDNLTVLSEKNRNRDVDDDGICKKKDYKIDKAVIKDTSDDNDMTLKNIVKKAAHAKEKEDNIKINVDSDGASNNASLKKIEPCKKKTSKKKCDEKLPENKSIKKIENTIEGSRIQPKETKKRENRKRLSSKETEKEKKESKLLNINTADNMHENKPNKDSKPHSKFTELFGESSSLITPEDLNIPTKLDTSIEHNENYGSLFENTQDAIDLNVTEVKKISQTNNRNLKVFENVEALSIKENATHINDKRSLFEINDDQSIDNVFKNLKPAVIDNESNVVRTVVISSGVQPCIEQNNTIQQNLTEMESNDAKETEKIVKHQNLELLRAVATSTPNKMQHEDLFKTTTTVSPNSLDNDSKVSYSASLTTATNVEDNSDAPDVRIFIKRRRKIKKL